MSLFHSCDRCGSPKGMHYLWLRNTTQVVCDDCRWPRRPAPHPLRAMFERAQAYLEELAP